MLVAQMSIRNIDEIRSRLSVLPRDMHLRALEVLNVNACDRRRMNCATTARYICGYLDKLNPSSDELFGFYRGLKSRSDTQTLILDHEPGEMVVFGGSMPPTLPDEHYAVLLEDESLFSMLGVGGPFSIDTIPQTFEMFKGIGDLEIDRVEFYRNLKK
jgi:hypothetical protein